MKHFHQKFFSACSTGFRLDVCQGHSLMLILWSSNFPQLSCNMWMSIVVHENSNKHFQQLHLARLLTQLQSSGNRMQSMALVCEKNWGLLIHLLLSRFRAKQFLLDSGWRFKRHLLPELHSHYPFLVLLTCKLCSGTTFITWNVVFC